jgi:hypothetical protein
MFPLMEQVTNEGTQIGEPFSIAVNSFSRPSFQNPSLLGDRSVPNFE